MHGIPLTYVNEHKYLGVWMNNTLQWHTHVTKTCNKANRTLGFLQRNLKKWPNSPQAISIQTTSASTNGLLCHYMGPIPPGGY